MSIFKSKAEKQLDDIILRLEMNMSNNYKDNAQDNMRQLMDAFDRMKNNGELKGRALDRYEKLISEYADKLAGYSHKDQKPYWT